MNSEAINAPTDWTPIVENELLAAEANLPRTLLGTTIFGIDALLESNVRTLSNPGDRAPNELNFSEDFIDTAVVAGNLKHKKLLEVSDKKDGNLEQISEISREITAAMFHKAMVEIHRQWQDLKIDEYHDFALVAFSELADTFRSKSFRELLHEYRESFTTKPDANGGHAERSAIETKILQRLAMKLENIDGDDAWEQYKIHLLSKLTFSY